VQHRRRPLDRLVDLVLRRLAQLQRERHVVVDRHVRVERVVLEHHRDVARLGLKVRDVPVSDEDRAGVDRLETGQHPKAGRLAAARRADENEEFAVVDFEIELVDGGRRAAGIDPGRLRERNCCHGRATFHRQERAGRSE
jgi:hypothetical protein